LCTADGDTAGLKRSASRYPSLGECLPAIESPTLVIQGLQDQYGTSKQVEAVVGGVTGRSESLMLADCRHAPHVDQREAIESAMARFVTSVADL
jgi:pimeloyl-ACP methyl ester carboxylesterase